MSCKKGKRMKGGNGIGNVLYYIFQTFAYIDIFILLIHSFQISKVIILNTSKQISFNDKNMY